MGESDSLRDLEDDQYAAFHQPSRWHSIREVFTGSLYWLAFIGIVASVSLAIFRFIQSFRSTSRIRALKLLQKLESSLRKAEEAGRLSPDDLHCEQIRSDLRSFLATFIDRVARAGVGREIEEALISRGVSIELARSTGDIVDRLDRNRYHRVASESPISSDTLIKDIGRLIQGFRSFLHSSRGLHSPEDLFSARGR